MRWLALLLCLMMPGALYATPYPALHNVTGVEAGDVLNIRSAPDASAQIIAELQPNDVDIEVIALDDTGKWGWVNIGESAGWVSMRFLDPVQAPDIRTMPRPLICTGTEPFWSLDLPKDPVAELDVMGTDSRLFTDLTTIQSANNLNHFAVQASSDDAQLNATIQRQTCSDDMSDRAYGLGITLLIRSEGEVGFFSGCCSLAR